MPKRCLIPATRRAASDVESRAMDVSVARVSVARVSVARVSVARAPVARAPVAHVSVSSMIVAAVIVAGTMLASVMASAAAVNAAESRSESLAAVVHHRRPSSMAFSGERLCVANRASGTVSVVDVAARRVTHEVRVGRRLSALVALGQSNRLLATDEATHELLVLSRVGEHVAVVGRHAVARYPVDVRAAEDGRWAAVTSLWSRRLTIVDLPEAAAGSTADGEVKTRFVVDLPCAPRRLLVAPDQRHVLVADNFGGTLAVVDATSGKLRSVSQVNAHQLGGLTTSHDGRQVLVAHQILNGRATTEDDPVFWGVVMTNVLQGVAWETLLGERDAGQEDALSRTGDLRSADDMPRADELPRGDVLPLGEPSHGTGDPGAIWISSKGKTVVCLGGVDEVAVRSSATQPMMRLPVGRRPIAVAADAQERWCVVANELDDSLSILEVATMRMSEPLSLGPSPKLTPAERGERLFYDARLSLDGWFSCHSCHVDGHTNDLVNDNQGDDSFGAPKRVPSLLGVGDTGPWAWNGGQSSLEAQISKSLHKTMRGGESAATDAHANDLTAYLRTLSAPPSIAAARAEPNSESARRGEQTFQRVGCVDCHAGPRLTSSETFDVGLRDELGGTRFNPPSLRGVSQRNAFLHDARARRLDQVLGVARHPDVALSEQDRRDLIEYLRRL